MRAESGPPSARPRHDDVKLWVALSSSEKTAKRRLLIISRDRRAFYEQARREFAGRDDIEVVLDRRVGRRRQQKGVRVLERRGRDRRRRPEVETLLRSTGYTLVYLH